MIGREIASLDAILAIRQAERVAREEVDHAARRLKTMRAVRALARGLLAAGFLTLCFLPALTVLALVVLAILVAR